MRKRKFTTVWVTAIIAVGILFAGTNVMALDDCNQVWTTGVSANKFSLPGSGTFQFLGTPYAFKFMGVTPVTCPPGASCQEGSTIYKWFYDFKTSDTCGPVPDPTPISNLQILVPSPVVDAQNIYYCGTSISICTPPPSDPNTGETNFGNNYFGFGLWQNQTILLTADGSSGQYYFYTDYLAIATPTSMYYKGGGNEFFAATKGPGPPQDPEQPFNAIEYKTIKNLNLKIYRSRGTWCADQIEYCVTGDDCSDGGTGWQVAESTNVLVDGQPIKNAWSVDGNQRCPESILIGGTNSFMVITSGGVKYKICLDPQC